MSNDKSNEVQQEGKYSNKATNFNYNIFKSITRVVHVHNQIMGSLTVMFKDRN